MKPLDIQHFKAMGIGTTLAGQLVAPLNKYLPDPRFAINTLARLAAFIGMAAEETGGFETLTEWATGNEYEGRADLGNTHPGDGIRYKGRGIFQETGRAGYASISHLIYGDDRLIEQPELLTTPDAAVLSACFYWKARGLNAVADSNPSRIWDVHVHGKSVQFTTFQWLTELINGGQNGYAIRLNYIRKGEIIFKDLFV